MVKIGNLTLKGRPKVALSVSDKERNKSIKSRNIDIVEIRLDLFRRLDAGHVRGNIALRRELGVPLILTIRSRKEGGGRNISDERKLKFFKDLISLVDAVDIELRSSVVSSVIDIAKGSKKTVIVSWHDFKSTPDNRILTDILNKAKAKGADIVKIAAKANRAEDVNRLMDFTQKNKRKNIITVALGDIGAISRLSFPMAGSLITYSYINKPSGPGQIPLDVLQEQLRLFYPLRNNV